MATHRPTLSISSSKKSQYDGSFFPAPKLIDTIEQHFCSEIIKILNERHKKNFSDVNEDFRAQRQLETAIHSIHTQIQLSFAKQVNQSIFDNLITDVVNKLKAIEGLDSCLFDKAIKAFKPSFVQQNEPTKVSYKTNLK